MPELPCGRAEICEPCQDLDSEEDRKIVCEAVAYVPVLLGQPAVAEVLGVSEPEDLSGEELYDVTNTYMLGERDALVSPEVSEAATDSAISLYHHNT